MKKYIYLVLILIFVCGCGGGSFSPASDEFANPNVDIEDPVSDPTSPAADGSQTAQDDVSTQVEEGPTIVLIKGSLLSAEGMGIPDATITFHSDPVQVITDAAGMFEAFLEVGSHTFEATSSAVGDISGSIIVSATGVVNETGQQIGSFIAEVGTAVGEWITCAAPRLADLFATTIGDTTVGILVGTFGHEVDAQGYNQTAIITGNSEMVANISIDGRLAGLFFPTVGAYNHIPYLSGVADWVKPFQGSFGGVKRGDDYYWFTDTAYWNEPEISYNSVVTAPIIEIIHEGTGDCSGARVKEKIYVGYDSYAGGGGRANVLVRDYLIESPSTLSALCRTTSNSSYLPELALYSRFNPNARHQLFKQWVPQRDDRECRDDRMYWTSFETSNYTIVMEGMDNYGRKKSMTCTDIYDLEDARKIKPDAECFPLSVLGNIAEWEIPSTKRLFVTTAGCDSSGGPCDFALDYIERYRPTSIESRVSSAWSSWLTGIESISSTTWRNRYKQWLVSMKMLSDRNTGAIVASPSQEPTYYYSWPRDGVYQSIAYIMAGKPEEAENFFNYLFDMAQNWDGGWTQAHSSLDGSDLGLPSSPLRVSVEEDQPPTVLWGLWVYWMKERSLPSSVTVEEIKRVANYIVGRICPFSGLLWPSLDWHENPWKDIGQSLYTNAAAHAGLLAAAEMVESSDPTAAATYREAARIIKEGIKYNLCTTTSCQTRIKYNPLWIDDLGDPIAACDHCLIAPYSNDEGEHIMAFAWPFHLFELGDPRVQSYYVSTKGTHSSLGDFSKDHSLWIPRYLYSHLYALEAVDNDEVPTGTFKSGLSTDISNVESNFPDLITDVGYLMDQYIGGEENLIYGGEYSDQKLGSAARPLGWSQAMGILTALAREGREKRVPMIGISSSCTDLCTSGAIKCEAGSTYNCITDSSGCLVWDAGTACASGACADATHCVGCIPADHTACYNNDVYSYDSCGVREGFLYDCGESEWTGSPICLGGDVWQSYYERDCSDEYGDCVAAIYDKKKEECGTSGYTGSDYCYSGDVYRDYVTRGCSSGACTSLTESRLQEECGSLGCTSGACNSECIMRSWSNNTLTAEDAGIGVRLRWNHPSPNWVHHYDIARETGSSVPQPSDVIGVTSMDSFVDTTALHGSRYRYIIFAFDDTCSLYRVASTLVTIDY